jgi:hypothetical protein
MTYRNEKYRRLVASLPCAYCGREGRSQAAHSNLSKHGKAFSLKASDAAIFPLCADEPGRQGHHSLFDQNRLFITKAEKIELTNTFIADTVIQLLERGELIVK